MPLWDSAIPGSSMDKLFAWQCHMGRCGGDGRRLRAREVIKRTMRDLVLSNVNPRGAAFPASSILIEPSHLRSDRSRPGDILALGRDVHRLDTAMDLVIAFGLTKSCLSSSSKSSDFVLKGAERAKFGKDRRSVNPIALSSTMRLSLWRLTTWGFGDLTSKRCSRNLPPSRPRSRRDVLY